MNSYTVDKKTYKSVTRFFQKELYDWYVKERQDMCDQFIDEHMGKLIKKVSEVAYEIFLPYGLEGAKAVHRIIRHDMFKKHPENPSRALICVMKEDIRNWINRKIHDKKFWTRMKKKGEKENIMDKFKQGFGEMFNVESLKKSMRKTQQQFMRTIAKGLQTRRRMQVLGDYKEACVKFSMHILRPEFLDELNLNNVNMDKKLVYADGEEEVEYELVPDPSEIEEMGEKLEQLFQAKMKRDKEKKKRDKERAKEKKKKENKKKKRRRKKN